MSDQDWTPPPPPGGGRLPPDPPPPIPPAPPSGDPFAPGEPPPGAPPPAAAPLPWEDRQRLGFVNALIETIKLLVTAPGEAFRRVREKGDFVGPLLFAVIIGWAMAIVGQIWSLMFQSTWISFLPPEMRDQIGPMLAGSAVGFIVTVILAPVLVTVGLFIWSGIVHLFLMLVGGTGNSTAGFEGTFRAASYAQVASLAQIVPILGGLIALVWGIILQAIGLATLHKTSQGKAAAAVLLPLVLCCVCAGVVVALVGASVIAALSQAAH